MAARKTLTVSTPRGLNLREEPSLDSRVLAVLLPGSSVVPDRKAKAPEGWTAISGGGYVMTKYLD